MTNFTSLSHLLFVQDIARKVKELINKLYRSGYIDLMTHKWLTIGLKQQRKPEFYTLTKIHKKTLVGRPIVSGSSGPTERISSFVDSLPQPVAIKQESYIKDTTDFINFIENTQIPDNVVLATLDVSSLYTNIPQEERIDVVCRYYENHYEQKCSYSNILSQRSRIFSATGSTEHIKLAPDHLPTAHSLLLQTFQLIIHSERRSWGLVDFI